MITQRITISAIDNIIGKNFSVLDKGFIRVIDYMGGDSAIVQAARVSYGDGTKESRQDEGLINYLIKNKHTSPFEMCEIKLHIKLPIFVARQWIRHRTANVNEVSARYSVLPNDFYIPSYENISTQSKNNKQGRGDILSTEDAKKIAEILTNDANHCYNNYKNMIDGNIPSTDNNIENLQEDNSNGIARELARMNLTLNFYTEWYWKTDLHNLLHFLNLRLHPHAQYEIREYAKVILDIVEKWCPMSSNAFKKHILNSVNISSVAKDLLKLISKHGTESTWFKDFNNNLDKNLSEINISKREYNEILSIIL